MQSASPEKMLVAVQTTANRGAAIALVTAMKTTSPARLTAVTVVTGIVLPVVKVLPKPTRTARLIVASRTVLAGSVGMTVVAAVVASAPPASRATKSANVESANLIAKDVSAVRMDATEVAENVAGRIFVLKVVRVPVFRIVPGRIAATTGVVEVVARASCRRLA
jgi:hypothetical protein